MIRAAALLLLAFAGCGAKTVDVCRGVSGTCIDLTVMTSQKVTVDELTLNATGAITETRSSPAGQSVTLPVHVGATLPVGIAGALHLQVDGSLGGALVASGATDLVIVSGQRNSGVVDLEPTVGGDGGPSDLAGSDGSGVDLSVADQSPRDGSSDLAGADLNQPQPDLAGHVLAWTSEMSGTSLALNGVGGSGPSDVWAIDDGTNGLILHSTGDGKWDPRPSNFPGVSKVWAFGPTDVYAVGAQGIVHSATGLSGSWVYQSTPASASLYGIWGSGPTDIYAVGSGGTIYHSIGDGNWLFQNPGTGSTVAFSAVWGSSSGDVFFVGSAGFALHSTGGGTFTGGANGVSTADLKAVWGSSSADVYAVGSGGAIIHSVGSVLWQVQTSGTSKNLAGVFGISLNEVYAVGDGGTVLKSTGNGMWSTVTGLPNVNYHGIWGTAGGGLFIVGDGGTILHGQ